jgi:hypothetical protein
VLFTEPAVCRLTECGADQDDVCMVFVVVKRLAQALGCLDVSHQKCPQGCRTRKRSFSH